MSARIVSICAFISDNSELEDNQYLFDNFANSLRKRHTLAQSA